MSVYQADLFTAIKAAAGITSIVGAKVHAMVAPASSSAPYLVYQVIGTSGQTHHDGARPVEFPLIQFSCWSETPAEAISLAAAVRAAFDGQTLAGTSNLSLVFSGQSGQYDDESELYGEIIEFSGACNSN